jgi:hypothetical protein
VKVEGKVKEKKRKETREGSQKSLNASSLINQ